MVSQEAAGGDEHDVVALIYDSYGWETTHSSFGPLHRITNEESFSWRHDHFQYDKNEDKEVKTDNNDDSRSKASTHHHHHHYYQYRKESLEDSFPSLTAQKNAVKATRRIPPRIPTHVYHRQKHDREEQLFGRHSAASNRAAAVATRNNATTTNYRQDMHPHPPEYLNDRDEMTPNNTHEDMLNARDDANQAISLNHTTPASNYRQRHETQQEPIPHQQYLRRQEHRDEREEGEQRADGGHRREHLPTDTNNNSSSILTNNTRTEIIRNRSTKINSSDEQELIDTSVAKAKAVEEAAYIMDLSEPKQYTIVLHKDYNPHDGFESLSGTDAEKKTNNNNINNIDIVSPVSTEFPRSPVSTEFPLSPLAGETILSPDNGSEGSSKRHAFFNDDETSHGTWELKDESIEGMDIDSAAVQSEKPPQMILSPDSSGSRGVTREGGGRTGADRTCEPSLEKVQPSQLIQQEQRQHSQNKNHLLTMRWRLLRSSAGIVPSFPIDVTEAEESEFWKDDDVEKALYREVEELELVDRDEPKIEKTNKREGENTLSDRASHNKKDHVRKLSLDEMRNNTTDFRDLVVFRSEPQMTTGDDGFHLQSDATISTSSWDRDSFRWNAWDRDSFRWMREMATGDEERYQNTVQNVSRRDRHQSSPCYVKGQEANTFLRRNKTPTEHKNENSEIQHPRRSEQEASERDGQIQQPRRSKEGASRHDREIDERLQHQRPKTIGSQDNPLRFAFKREAMDNLLIDLIHREMFNFALQRVRHFPDETRTRVSNTNQNLALHEIIIAMVFGGDDLNGRRGNRREAHHAFPNREETYPIQSILLQKMIEANPQALSTPGNGGYLPLHVICSSTFRNCGVCTRLNLIRTMLAVDSEGASNNQNETGELPLHFAIRWICRHGHRSNTLNNTTQFSKYNESEREDESIAMFLFLANPGGAGVRDLSGVTPHEILQKTANLERERQQNADISGGGSIVQRLERYFTFACELPQASSVNYKDEVNWQPRKGLHFAETREPNDDLRDRPPIDHIELADTMDGTEIVEEPGLLSSFKLNSIPSSRATEKGGKYRSLMKNVEMGFIEETKQRLTRKRTKAEHNEMDSEFAEDLLRQLLDSPDDLLENLHLWEHNE